MHSSNEFSVDQFKLHASIQIFFCLLMLSTGTTIMEKQVKI